jgi:hypothetical protein
MTTKNRFVLTVFCSILFLFSGGRTYGGETLDLTKRLKIPMPGLVQILTTKDGSTIIGRIVEVGDTEVRFETKMGKLTIPIQTIKRIKDVPESSIREGQYWYPNPNATRLYFGPTARMLKKGEGYFADYELFFPALTVGVTDRITIGGGMSIFPGVSPNKQLFYLTPKVGLKSYNNLQFAAGALVIKVPDESRLVGILYSLGTFGTPDGSVSVGLGYGFFGSHAADKPMVMVGGEKRLTRRVAVVSENWIIPGADHPVVAYGIRLMGEGLSFDIAFLNTLGHDAIFPGIPYVDLAFKF